MDKLRPLFLAGLLALAALTPAEAEPCVKEGLFEQICGKGPGGARVIVDTISPSKRLALAWRTAKRPPTQEPGNEPVESVLIRLSDGAVLDSAPGKFWGIESKRAKDYEQLATWSANSRLMVKQLYFGSKTVELHLYSLGADDKPAATLDIKPIVEASARKQLTKMGKKEKDFDFAIFGYTDGHAPYIKFDKNGRIAMSILMAHPKHKPYLILDAVFQMSESNGVLDLREVSIRQSRINRDELQYD
jgi:hypothetical protein